VVITKKPKAGYYAQVNAPDNSAEAEKIAKKLQGSGFPVVIESASTKGKTFYRVLVGPEQNKVQAERLLGQLKGEKYIKGSPFIKSVK
jgi:cell division septation protein DedD